MKKITIIFLNVILVSLLQAQEFECGDEVTFTYRGVSVTYGTVEGENGTCWLDRNLGASRVATSYNDSEAYGDLFQWGRLDDGHQARNSGKTDILSNTDVPGHADFITNNTVSPFDWRSPQNNKLWQYPDYINNPCPDNWRVPTETELLNEMDSWADKDINGAFNSPLKFTAGGLHNMIGNDFNVGSAGYYWSSTIDGVRARRLNIVDDNAETVNILRVTGVSVRCIKIYEFAGGDGSSENPFEIETAEQLNNVRNYVGSAHSNKHFKLMNDIDLGDFLSEGNPGYNEGAFWAPIGHNDDPFRGIFDGNNKVIRNLKINRPDASIIGLFSVLGDMGEIKNLGIEIDEGSSITGLDVVGSIAAWNNSGTITGCYAKGTVKGNALVGGLVGSNNSIITKSYFNGEVKAINDGSTFIGGLSGYNEDGNISESYSSGSVSSTKDDVSYLGGLVGINFNGEIENSYSTSSVIANGEHIGGLVGGNNNGKVIHCYSAGTVEGIDNVGGLAGSIVSGANYEDTGNYWDIETSETETSAMGTGKLTTEMKAKGTFIDGVGDEVWDFNDVWNIKLAVSISYPYLKNNEQIPAPGAELLFAGGDGSSGNPLQIETPVHLDNMRMFLGDEHVNKHFKLMNDIDLSEHLSEGNPGYNEGAFWKPIGDSDNRFRGKLDGNDYEIRNLKINRPETTFVGLFGILDFGGEIKSLGVKGDIEAPIYGNGQVSFIAGNSGGSILDSYALGFIHGKGSTGGIVGVNNGEVDNCYFEGDIVAIDGSNFGGLVGSNNTGTIRNSHSTGSIEGKNENNNLGGLVGSNGSNATIENSYSKSTVSGGGDRVGGLVGISNGSVSYSFATGNVAGKIWIGGLVGYVMSATITNSYATGNIVGHQTVGGLIGSNYRSKVINCYSTGKPTGNSVVGGLVGMINDGGDFEDSGNFWDTGTSETETSAMGTGKTTAEMKTKTTFTIGEENEIWDFTDVWNIKVGLNVSYPYLKNNEQSPVPGEAMAFAGGAGSQENPFQIETPVHLDHVRVFLGDEHDDKYFKLMNDIDLSTYLSEGNPGYNDGAFWKPIGSLHNRFRGKFDGNDKLLNNLKINRPDDNRVGLFGFIGEEGEINNLGIGIDEEDMIKGSNFVGAVAGNNFGSIDQCNATGTLLGKGYVGGITGGNSGIIQHSHFSGAVEGEEEGEEVRNIGGLVGYNYDIGTINYCSSSGTVTVMDESRHIGGLVGSNRGAINNSFSSSAVTGYRDCGGLVGSSLYHNSSVNNSYATGNVTGDISIGGLAGIVSDSSIEYCYATGNVVSTNYNAGGLAGTAISSTIENCYATGNVNGNNRVGGLIGSNQNSKVQNCYSSGKPTGSSDIGGLAGGILEGDDFEDTGNFWDTETSQTAISAMGSGKSTAKMKTKATFISGEGDEVWDFDEVWAIKEGLYLSYPYLANNMQVPAPGEEYMFAGGDGTEENPFEIETPLHLDRVRNFLGDEHSDKHFKLMNDIGLSEYLSEGNPGYNEGAFWIPIGSSEEQFKGYFNGNNNKIINLKINRQSQGNVGLFGYLGEGGEIVSLGVEVEEGVYIRGNWNVAGLVGHNIGSISSCYAYGFVHGHGSVGGLVGYNAAEVKNSYAVGEVYGSTNVGGLVGANLSGTIETSYSSCKVGDNPGVKAGSSNFGGLVGYNFEGIISNSYATGNVSGDENVGGLLGNNYQGKIINCYSTGEPTGYNNIGGLVGRIDDGGDYEDMGNFWDTETSGVDETAGNATGLTTAEMKMQATFATAGWNFVDVWSIVANDGKVYYPYLADNPEDPAPGLANAYIVTFSSNEDGTLSAEIGTTAFASGMLIAENAEVVLTATPDPDFMVEWKVNNVTLSVYPLSYTIQNLDEDTEVIATFSPIVVEWPTLSNITYGQPLSESNFSSADTNLDGVFEFVTPAEVLDAGTHNEVAVTFTPIDTENYSPVSGTVTVEVDKKELTIGGSFTAHDKTYDRTSSAELDGNSLELDGKVGDDDVSITGITLAFASTNVNTGIQVSITTADLDGVSKGNYTLSLTGAPTTTADINAKELTVTGASVAAKVYDGNTDANIEGGLLSGVISPDDVNLENATQGVFAQATVGDGISVTTSMSISGSAHSNYYLTQPTLTGNITHRPLVITPNSFNKTVELPYTFDGTEFTTDNLVTGDAVTEVELTSTGAAAEALAGEYDIVITPDSEDGTGLDNYDISYGIGKLNVVDQTELITNGLAVDSRIYDGTTDATVSNWGSLDGVTEGDDVILDHSSAVVEFDSKHAGQDKDVTISGLALSGADADKYYINNHIAEADITKRALTPNNFSAESRVYDGTTEASFAGFSDDRIVGDEIFFTFEASFVDKHVGASKTVYFTDITIASGADMNNYYLETTTGTAYADITAKELNVVNTVAQNKTYDGTDVAMLEDAELSTADLLSGDDVILGNHTIGTFAQVTVGDGIDVTTAMTISGDDAHNYDLIQPDGLTADITLRPLTITPDNFVKPYGELYEFDGTEFTTDNLVAGDEVATVGLTSDGAAAEANPADYDIVIIPDSEDGIGLENYHISYAEGILSVRKEISVDGLVADDKLYDGTTDATISDWGSLAGVTEGDDVTLDHSSAVADFASKDVGKGIDVTVTGLELTGGDAKFYMLTEVVVKADITAKQLTIGGSFTVNNKVYDGTTEAEIDDNSLTLTGIVNDENVELVDIVAEFASAGVAENITVNITNADIAGDDAGNYTLTLDGAPTTTADIVAITHTVTFSVEGGNGTLIAEVDGIEINTGDEIEEGRDVVFTATPDDGFKIKQWTFKSDVVSGHTELTYSVEYLDGDIEVTVEFEEEEVVPTTFTVTFSVEGGNGTLIAEAGGIEINTGDEIEKGKNVVFTATPDENFKIKEWTLNGVVVTSQTDLTYTVVDLDDDVEVKVVLEEVVGIDEIAKVEVLLFPNPSRDKFTIRSSEMIQNIRLVNITGQVVIDIKVDAMQTEVNINKLHPGLFFMQIYTDKGIVTERVQVAK